MGKVQRSIVAWLSAPDRRSKWHDTRAITQGIHKNEWADQQQIESVLQGLRKLQQRGLVQRSGFVFADWKIAK